MPALMGVDVPDVDPDQLRSSQRTGEPVEQQRTIPDTAARLHIGVVDQPLDGRVDDGRLLLGLPAGSRPMSPQSAHHLHHGQRVVRRGQTLTEMHQPDRGQAMGERGFGEAEFGLGADEHRHGVRLGGQGHQRHRVVPGGKDPPRAFVSAPRAR